MSFIEIQKNEALNKYIEQTGAIYVLRPIGDKGRKALFNLNELFEGCIFLEDIDSEVVAKISSGSIYAENDESSDGDEIKTRGRRPIIDDGKLRTLYSANWSIKDIAEEFGVKPRSVENYIYRHNITR